MPGTNTPHDDASIALHWAAAVQGLKEVREAAGNPLTADELVNYEKYQSAARSHGITAAQIAEYRRQHLG